MKIIAALSSCPGAQAGISCKLLCGATRILKLGTCENIGLYSTRLHGLVRAHVRIAVTRNTFKVALKPHIPPCSLRGCRVYKPGAWSRAFYPRKQEQRNTNPMPRVGGDFERLVTCSAFSSISTLALRPRFAVSFPVVAVSVSAA